MIQKSRADQSIQYTDQNNQNKQEITEETLLELKYNNGFWHIFRNNIPGDQKCMCGSKRKSSYHRNHCSKKRTAQEILENPSQGLGTTPQQGLNKLQNKVKP